MLDMFSAKLYQVGIAQSGSAGKAEYIPDFSQPGITIQVHIKKPFKFIHGQCYHFQGFFFDLEILIPVGNFNPLQTGVIQEGFNGGKLLCYSGVIQSPFIDQKGLE